ncbi:MAG: hypothetical protein Tsb0015_10420 [Simkaniaceae bacterium]
MDAAFLKELNEQGFLAGPNETKENFLTRIKAASAMNPKQIFPKWKDIIPLDPQNHQNDIAHAIARTRSVFGISSPWLPGFFSNKKLPFWLGGVTWLVQEKAGSLPILQLRKEFFRKKRSKLYSFTEIYAHELVHAARAAFNEPKFEEIFAYRTSSQSFRRNLGAIFQRPFESAVFLAVLFSGIFFRAYSLLSIFLPIGLGAYFLLRLIYYRRLLAKCLNKLSQVFLEDPFWIALRLTDREIISFSRFSLKEIQSYIKAQSSLRWLQIRSSFTTRSN